MTIQYPFDLAQSDSVRRQQFENAHRVTPIDARRVVDHKRYAPRGANSEGRIWWITKVRAALGPEPRQVRLGLVLGFAIVVVLVLGMAAL